MPDRTLYLPIGLIPETVQQVVFIQIKTIESEKLNNLKVLLVNVRSRI